MKALCSVVCLFALPTAATRLSAQVPREVPFQGVLTDATGKPVTGARTVTFTLYDTADSPIGWSETKSVSAQRGVFSTLLGDTTAIPASIAFDKPYYVGLRVSGESSEMAPHLPLASVPYALTAAGLALPYSQGTPAAGTAFRIDSTAATGPTVGVRATVASPDGIGIHATHISSGNIGALATRLHGVEGADFLPGVNGAGLFGASTNGSGVFATSSRGDGVVAESFNASAVRGEFRVGAAYTTGGYLGRGNVGVQGLDVRSDKAGYGIQGFSINGRGIMGSQGSTYDTYGVLGTTVVIEGVTTFSAAGIGAYGRTASSIGVMGHSTADYGTGIYAKAEGSLGEALRAESTAPAGSVYGILATAASPGGAAAYLENWGGGNSIVANGRGAGRYQSVLRVDNSNPDAGMDAYLTNNSNFATAHIANSGSGEVLYLQSNTGPTIKCVNKAESAIMFEVRANGEVHAAAAFYPNGGDFAELLPAASGLEPGDVLAIGPDGTLSKSTETYQVSVAGVYSTRPGTVGVTPEDRDTPGKVPLAVVGVVPVKVCAENGAISPGNLLTTSSMPGYAMKATDRTRMVGAIIGKALTRFTGPGEGTVRALVNLK